MERRVGAVVTRIACHQYAVLDFLTLRHMRTEFVSSRICCESFLPEHSGFSLLQKPAFDLICCDSARFFLVSSTKSIEIIIIKSSYYYFHYYIIQGLIVMLTLVK